MKKGRKKGFILGCVLLSIIALLAIIGLFFTPFDPEMVDTKSRYLAPSLKHLLGTDNLGRDVLSRVMVGCRTTILVAFGIIGIGGIIGTIVGLVTAYFGGLVDEIIMRINDGIASFPSILLAVVCVAILGSNTTTTVVALGVLFIPSFARVIRSECLREKEKDYINNLKIWGAHPLRIMFRHILPNTLESLISAVIIGINNAIIAESSLSFLGLGVQPPAPSLGRMMSDGQSFILKMPWVTIFPGIAIVFVVLGLSLVAKKDDKNKEYAIKGKVYLKNTENKEQVLEVENLKVSVDEEILKGISFSLSRGEVLGIVGESGSGKSTTANAVMEVLSDVRGLEITEVFQEPFTALDPLKKIGYQMKEVCLRGLKEREEYKNASKKELESACAEIIKDTLEKVELKDSEHILKAYPHYLSGGERQRVIIGMAIMNNPRVIVCDEPTTALDKDVEEKIIELLLKLKAELNLAMVFISHDIGIVKRVSDRILVIKDGLFTDNKKYKDVFLKVEKPVVYKELAGDIKESSESVISVKDVNIYYLEKGEKKYLRKGISFDLKAGHMLGIKGGSGCGKSTLLKAICGLIPYEGSIEKTKDLSMVFQDPYSSLDPCLTVEAMLKEVLVIDAKEKKLKEKVDYRAMSVDMIKAVGLSEEYLSRYPEELSGGERQRVAIACALITRPELVLLDEPVTALDVTNKDAVMRLLMELKAQYGLTYIMVSHDEELLVNSCDSIMNL